MTEAQFKLEIWRHLVAIFRAVALYWFQRPIVIEGVSQDIPFGD